MRVGRAQVGRWVADHPYPLDALLAVSFTIVTLRAGAQFGATGWRAFDSWAFVLTCLANLPLAVRRRAPRVVLAICCTGVTAYLLAGYYPSLNLFGPLLALYSVAAYRSTRSAALGAVATSATVFLSGINTHALSVEVCVAEAVLSSAIAWFFGNGTRSLAQRNAELAYLTERLEYEQAARAQRAVTDERVRIARELHDVVAHHMSVISIQAGLAQYVYDTDPVTSRGALATIVKTSHEALDDMRQLLCVLRPGAGDSAAAPYEPAPGLRRLDELIERMRAAGLVLELTVRGDETPLVPGQDVCAYRIIQEALTNVLKHAPGAHTWVTVLYGPQVLTVRITNDRPPGPARTDPGAVGHGLIGMHERARVYGGTLTAGPRAQGGFEVALTLALPRSGLSQLDADGNVVLDRK